MFLKVSIESPRFTYEDIDFEPGKLLIDFVPFLQYLPLALQPWHQRLAPLVERELALHFAFLKTLRKALEAGRGPDCFGKMLIEVCAVLKLISIGILTHS